MASHDELLAYSDNVTATAAAHAESTEGGVEYGPYRVWQCASCRWWHAAPWLGHGHYPEVDVTPQGVSV